MKVINVADFDLSFEKDGKMYRVPNDGNLHNIPDICYYEDNFQGLLRVVIPPKSVKQVIKKLDRPIDVNNLNNKDNIISIIEEQERKKFEKPLKGKKLKASIRDKHKKIKLENKTTNPNGRKGIKKDGEDNKS